MPGIQKLCLGIGMAVLMVAANLGSAQTDGASREVRSAEASRTSALVKGDVNSLEKLLADDLTYVHASGKIDNKTSFLEGIRSGTLRYLSWEQKEMHVRMLNDVAILNGKYAVKAVDHRVQQDPIETTVIILSVYAKRQGHWQQLAWQSTRDTGVSPALPKQ